ncbi:MAG TPA: hypothetical protein VIB99_07505 [Candidatus Limnocylindrales bacterium]
MSGTPGSPYAADGLAANQAGRLTDQQRQQFRGRDRSFRKNELIGAAGAAIIGILLITSSGPTANAWLRPVGTVVAFVIAAVLLYRATLSGDALSSDLASGSVETVEGAVLRDVRQGQHTEWFYLHVAGKSFEVPRSIYEAAPEAGYVRVYFLPRSKTVVNLERLAAPPLPAGAAGSPATLAQEALASIGSGDLNQRAEAMAQIAGLKASMEQALAQPVSVAAPGPDGTQPMAEAIVGTWQAGPIRVSFAADGSLSMTLPGGRQQAGTWSVDATGVLRAQLGGQSEMGEARISGDTLVVGDGKEMLSLKRA